MINLEQIAEHTLDALSQRGFDAAQVAASLSEQDEVYIGHNEANMLRSTEAQKLVLTGIVDGRKATTEVTDFDGDAVADAVNTLYETALLAPQDEANAVSNGQQLDYRKGPTNSDLDKLTDKVAELLAFRSEQTPLITKIGRAHV